MACCCASVPYLVVGLLSWFGRTALGSAVYGEWAEWSDCSDMRCSTQTRTRDCQETNAGSTPECDSKLKQETRSCNTNFCFGDDLLIATLVSAGVALLLVIVVVVLCIRRRRAQRRFRDKKSHAKSSRPKPSQNPAEYVENLYDEMSRNKGFNVNSNKHHENEGFEDFPSTQLSKAGSIGSFSVSKNSSNVYLPGIDDAASDISVPKVKFNPLCESHFPDKDDYDLDLDSLESGTEECVIEKTVTFGPEKQDLSQYLSQSDPPEIARPGIMKVVTSCETQTDGEGIVA